MSKLKILIAIDEPELAKLVIYTAYNLINRNNFEITLLNIDENTVEQEEYFYKAPQKFIEHEAEKSDFAYLEDFLEKSEVDYKGFIYREGNAAENIINMAENDGYDLVIVGSHNKHVLQRFFLGSVSYKVAKYCKSSVMVIKPSELSIINDNQDYSVLFAADSSQYSENASRRLSDFLNKKRAEVTILNVCPPIQETIPADAYVYTDIARIMEESQNIAEDILKDIYIDMARQGINVIKKYHVTGDPALAIIEEAEINKSNLIVTGSHVKTGLAEWIIGSVSSRVVEYSPTSVLIIK